MKTKTKDSESDFLCENSYNKEKHHKNDNNFVTNKRKRGRPPKNQKKSARPPIENKIQKKQRAQSMKKGKKNDDQEKIKKTKTLQANLKQKKSPVNSNIDQCEKQMIEWQTQNAKLQAEDDQQQNKQKRIQPDESQLLSKNEEVEDIIIDTESGIDKFFSSLDEYRSQAKSQFTLEQKFTFSDLKSSLSALRCLFETKFARHAFVSQKSKRIFKQKFCSNQKQNLLQPAAAIPIRNQQSNILQPQDSDLHLIARQKSDVYYTDVANETNLKYDDKCDSNSPSKLLRTRNKLITPWPLGAQNLFGSGLSSF